MPCFPGSKTRRRTSSVYCTASGDLMVLIFKIRSVSRIGGSLPMPRVLSKVRSKQGKAWVKNRAEFAHWCVTLAQLTVQIQFQVLEKRSGIRTLDLRFSLNFFSLFDSFACTVSIIPLVCDSLVSDTSEAIRWFLLALEIGETHWGPPQPYLGPISMLFVPKFNLNPMSIQQLDQHPIWI